MSIFVPKYNYFKPDEKTLEIRLEVPGNVKLKPTHTVIGDESIITIKGKKSKDKKPDKIEDNVINLREYGDFELKIPLKVQEFKLISNQPIKGFPKFVNGICKIQYALLSEEKDDKGEEGVEDQED